MWPPSCGRCARVPAWCWSPPRRSRASSTRRWRRAAAGRAAASGATAVSPAMLQRLTSPESQNGPATEALTPRETAVLLFLADGLSNEEISRRLFISIHTLRNHIQNIIGKLGAHSKLEAVSIAIREGLITAPSHEH